MDDFETQIITLANETTIVKLEDNISGATLYEDTQLPDYHPQSSQFRNVYDFNNLNIHWNNKWNSFGNIWTHERQIFRYIWSEIRAFRESFKQYQDYFNVSLNLSSSRINNLQQRNQLDLRAEIAIKSMYEYGKQAIDLLNTLNDEAAIQNIITAQHIQLFLNQFKETRNKFLIHYHDPHRYRNFIFDPVYISLMSTGGLFEVNIHIQRQVENRFTAEINHYADYFRLEEIFISIIRSF